MDGDREDAKRHFDLCLDQGVYAFDYCLLAKAYVELLKNPEFPRYSPSSKPEREPAKEATNGA
jgi:hypothetical protein